MAQNVLLNSAANGPAWRNDSSMFSEIKKLKKKIVTYEKMVNWYKQENTKLNGTVTYRMPHVLKAFHLFNSICIIPLCTHLFWAYINPITHN